MTGDAASPVMAMATAGARASFFMYFLRKLQLGVKYYECNGNATFTTRIVVFVLFSTGFGPVAEFIRHSFGTADSSRAAEQKEGRLSVC